jgi:hypothetical protein
MPASSVSDFGVVQNPVTTSITDGVEAEKALGKQAQTLVDQLHGKYFNSAYRNQVFTANRTALTIPVIASGLVSVFTLWNPASSRALLELISLDIGLVLATTVVDTVGLYWQNGSNVTSGTFTTVGVKGTNWFNARPSQPIGQGSVLLGLHPFRNAGAHQDPEPVRRGDLDQRHAAEHRLRRRNHPRARRSGFGRDVDRGLNHLGRRSRFDLGGNPALTSGVAD